MTPEQRLAAISELSAKLQDSLRRKESNFTQCHDAAERIHFIASASDQFLARNTTQIQNGYAANAVKIDMMP